MDKFLPWTFLLHRDLLAIVFHSLDFLRNGLSIGLRLDFRDFRFFRDDQSIEVSAGSQLVRSSLGIHATIEYPYNIVGGGEK